MKREKTFEMVCEYALLKYPKREGKSRAQDLSHTYFINPWANDKKHHMVLYEGEKQIARGKTEPEVYWVVIDGEGRVRKMPARNIRQMTRIAGFAFVKGVWEAMEEVLDWVEEHKNETEESK